MKLSTFRIFLSLALLMIAGGANASLPDGVFVTKAGAKQEAPHSVDGYCLPIPKRPNDFVEIKKYSEPTKSENVFTAAKSMSVKPRVLHEAKPAPNATKVYGSVTYSGGTLSTGLYNIPLSSDLDFENVVIGPDASSGGVAVGNLYYNVFYFKLWDYYTYVFVECYNLETGERISSGNARTYSIIASDVAYDPSSGKVYGCFYNDNGDGYQFGIADYTNKRSEAICTVDTPWHACAIDAQGKMYALTMTGDLLSVDKTTGATTLIGNTGIKPAYAGSACIDERSGRMFWSVVDENTNSAIYEVDPQTAKVTLLNSFTTTHQVCGMYSPAPEANDGAPAQVENLAINFVNGSLSGIVSFTAPTINYDGKEASGDLTYTILANDKTVATGTTQYGQTVNANVKVDESNNYRFVAYVSNTVGDGAKSKINGFIGIDTPNTPTVSLSYSNGAFTVSWDAITTSKNNGYIVPEEVTYTVVRYPDNKVVAEGIKETSITDPVERPETLVVYYYTVTATFSGVSSAAGKSDEIIIGIVNPPYSVDFSTEDDFKTFTTIDGNSNGKTWSYYKRYQRVRLLYDSKKQNDDWLITPGIKLEGGKAYLVSFDAYCDSDYPERIEVKAGTSATADAMTLVAINPTLITEDGPQHVEGYLNIAEDGVYYVGFHGISDADTDYLDVDNISVSTGITKDAPGEVTDFTITPDPNGSKIAVISFKAPTISYAGDTIKTLDKVEVCRDGEVINTFTEVTPGGNLSMADAPLKADYYEYTVYAYNASGRGKPTSKKVFVGVNVMKAPTAVKINEPDNDGKIELSWTAPATDIAGEPAILSHVTYNVIADGEYIASGLTDTKYQFQAVEAGTQKFVQYGVVAVTESGVSESGVSDLVPVGTPYATPFTESFANKKSSTIFSTDMIYGVNDANGWELFNDSSIANISAQDGDNGYAGFYATVEKYSAYFSSGKIDLAALANPSLIFYANKLCNSALNTNSIEVQISTDGLTFKSLKTVSMDMLEVDGWNKIIVPLNSYKGQVIQVRFIASSYYNLYTIIDNISIKSAVDVDLAATSVTVPQKVAPNTDFDIVVSLLNEGGTNVSNYNVDIYRDNEKINSINGNSIAAGEATTVKTTDKLSVMDNAEISYRAEVTLTGDMVADNNITDNAVTKLVQNNYPSLSDITANVEGNKVNLSWEKPEIPTQAPEAVTDDFESYDSWSTSFVGDWTFIDGDNGNIGGLTDISLPGINGKQSFWVMDASLPSLNDSFTAHSGKKYLANMYNSKVVDDWAITPRLSGKEQTITLYARSYHEDYPETFELLYSTTGKSTDNFTLISTQSNVSNEWTKYEAKVPDGARYLAIRCISNDAFMLFIDDVTYQPAIVGEDLTTLGYNVYRNGKITGDSTPSTVQPNFTDMPATDNTALTYNVTVVYDAGESKPSNSVTVNLSGISDNAISSNALISTQGTDVIVSNAFGHNIAIYGIDGIVVAQPSKANEDTKKYHLTKGIYIVTIDSTATKLILR